MNLAVQNPYIGFKDADGNPSPPLPKQVEAFNMLSKCKHFMFAGSFGTGKTEFLVQAAINDALKYPGNEILMGRKRLDWFESSTLPILLNALPPELIIRHDKQKHNIYLKTGGKQSVIYYRQLDASREAINQIKSMNLGLFAPDQVEELDVEVFQAAIGRLRKQNTPRQSVSTCNPAGHNWAWKRWVSKQGGQSYGYIESRMWRKENPPPVCQNDVTLATSDNPYLPWDYIADLIRDYPDHWLNRYVYCGWDNFEGLVYPMWDEQIHVIKPFDVPDWWNWYIPMDHGHRNPTAVGFWASNGDGDVYLVDLHYKADKWVDYHAMMIQTMMQKHSLNMEDITAWPADPSIFSQHTEVTIADEYEDLDIYWDKANNDVSGGINRVATYLKPDEKLITPQFPKGKPKMFVFERESTMPFLDEIGEYHWEDISVRGYNKNRPEKPRKKNDHSMDMMKYLINYIEDADKPVIKENLKWLRKQQSSEKAWMGI
jgi:phage terminase large subunit|tara:strand:+ start:1119 stop:2576 length:1458 start_codon:yes stop_codon:yes gene_type:complete